MPTYQYRCKECGHDFEIVQAFSDDALTKCPECKKKALKKVYGNVGISFKGSGFYKNDARSSGSSSKSSSSDSTPKGNDKSDTKSAESKPEKKADNKSEKKSTSSSSSD
ncbi:MAG: FmdB family transcriptional regulator [Acidimicrobiales bacterium]|nr:FmdB family transcriptional regulator [Acidimicrobiales bacterium]